MTPCSVTAPIETSPSPPAPLTGPRFPAAARRSVAVPAGSAERLGQILQRHLFYPHRLLASTDAAEVRNKPLSPPPAPPPPQAASTSSALNAARSASFAVGALPPAAGDIAGSRRYVSPAVGEAHGSFIARRESVAAPAARGVDIPPPPTMDPFAVDPFAETPASPAGTTVCPYSRLSVAHWPFPQFGHAMT